MSSLEFGNRTEEKEIRFFEDKKLITQEIRGDMSALVDEVRQPLDNNDSIEIKRKSNKELINILLYKETVKAPRKSKRDRKIQDKWVKNYAESSRKENIHLIKGWERMKNSKLPDGRTHLQMVYDTCKKYKVPFEVVFQALHESNWNRKIGSRAGAKGPWQFLKGAARDYGLVVNSKRDDRQTWEKSTKAAVRYMRTLYKLTFRWDDKFSKRERQSISDSDRWCFAMWSYNRGMGHVRKDFRKAKGQSEKYTRYCWSSNPKSGKYESAGYVNKIFAVKQVIRLHEKAAPQVTAQEIINSPNKSIADRAFENWASSKDTLTTSDNKKRLVQIKKMYKQEIKKVHHEKYVSNAVKVIDGFIEKYENTIEKTDKKTESDIAFEKYRLTRNMPIKKKLKALSSIANSYEEDLERGVHSEIYVRRALDVIRKEEKKVFEQYIATFEGDLKERKVRVLLEDSGDLVISVLRKDPKTKKIERIKTGSEDYTLKTSHSLNTIAIWMSGRKEVSGTVLAALQALNPELKDFKYNQKIPVNTRIRVPGKYVEVPDKKLDDLLPIWYPGRNNSASKKYLKSLNNRQKIKPGDFVLVPNIIEIP